MNQNLNNGNPLNLIETILRQRVFECVYWKQHCFGLNEALLIEKAVQLKSIGGACSANNKPTDFLCLLVKLLQIQPQLEIILELINNEEYKYVRALGVIYLRMTGKAVDIYSHLEPLYDDYRKLRLQTRNNCKIICMDEFIDQLLTEHRVCDIALPRLPQRRIFEEKSILKPRVSSLQAELDNSSSGDDDSSSDSDDSDSESSEDPNNSNIGENVTASMQNESPKEEISSATEPVDHNHDEAEVSACDDVDTGATSSKRKREDKSPKHSKSKKESKKKKKKKTFFIKGLKS